MYDVHSSREIVGCSIKLGAFYSQLWLDSPMQDNQGLLKSDML